MWPWPQVARILVSFGFGVVCGDEYIICRYFRGIYWVRDATEVQVNSSRDNIGCSVNLTST